MRKLVLLLMIVSIVSIECRPSSWYYTDGNYAVEDRQFSNFLDTLGGQHHNIWFDEFLDDDYDLFDFPETPSFPEVHVYGSKHGPVNGEREENLGQFLDDVFGADASQEYPEKARDLSPFVQKVVEDAKTTAKKIARVEYEKALRETSYNNLDIEDIVRREFSAFEPEDDVQQHMIPHETTPSPDRSLDDILSELFPGGETTESSLDTLYREHRAESTPTDAYGVSSTPKTNFRSIDDILNELFTPTENANIKEVIDDSNENVEDIARETFAAFEPVADSNDMRSPWERDINALFASGERHDMESSDTRQLWSKSPHPNYHNNKDVRKVKVHGADIDDILNELFNTPGSDRDGSDSTTPEPVEKPEHPAYSTSTSAAVSTTDSPPSTKTPSDGSFEDNAFFEAWKKNIQESIGSHDNGVLFPNHFAEGDYSLDSPPNLQLIPPEMDTFHLMSVSDPCTGHGLIDELDHLSKLMSLLMGKETEVENEGFKNEDNINNQPFTSSDAETEWISHPRSSLNPLFYNSKYSKYFRKHEANLRSRRHQGAVLPRF